MFPLRQFLFQKNSRDILLFEKKKREIEKNIETKPRLLRYEN